MASTYKGLPLFNSGPHRFALRREGQLVVPEFTVNGVGSGSLHYGLVELSVVVTGRLIAATDAALWALRDAITAQLLDPPTPGALIDHHGRVWNGMSFTRFEPADRTDRARDVSLAYTATFLRFHTL